MAFTITARKVAHGLQTLACLSLLAAPCVRATDEVDPWDGAWHTRLSVYGWLPGISAKTRYQLPQGTILENRSGNIYNKLSGALMVEATFQKGRWGIYTDVDWAKFSDQKGHIAAIGSERFGANAGLNTRWNLKGGMVTLAGSYTVGYSSQGSIDVLVGARYLWLKGNIGWDFSLTGNRGRTDIDDDGHLNRQTHITAGIIGIRGRWTPFPSKAVFMPYYFDIGTGSSDRTQQYAGGIGYAFHWGDIALLYRDVEYHQHGSDAFLHDVRLSGPSLNLTWTF
jgi:hypothetical protein